MAETAYSPPHVYTRDLADTMGQELLFQICSNAVYTKALKTEAGLPPKCVYKGPLKNFTQNHVSERTAVGRNSRDLQTNARKQETADQHANSLTLNS